MKIIVDQGRCQGHGKCYLTAPELFTPHDDWGRAEPVNPAVDADMNAQKKLADAVLGCPEGAISVSDELD